MNAYERMVKVFPMLAKVEDKEVADKIAEAWALAEKESAWERVEDACFSPSIPNIRLIDHVNSTTEGGAAIAEVINRNHGYDIDVQKVIVLGLMHDVGKVVEYEPGEDGGNRLSRIGRLIPHGCMSGEYANRVGLPMEMIHLIITHSSWITMEPKELEGEILQFADFSDGQTHCWKNGQALAKIVYEH